MYLERLSIKNKRHMENSIYGEAANRRIFVNIKDEVKTYCSIRQYKTKHDLERDRLKGNYLFIIIFIITIIFLLIFILFKIF